MNALRAIEEIVDAVERAGSSQSGLDDAALLTADLLGAEEVYLLYGAEAFQKVGDAGDPEDLEIKQNGYWLINRHLVKQGGVCAFGVEGGKVVNLVVARPGLRRSHLAVLLPMQEGIAEMLLVRGLRGAITRSALALVSAAGPIFADVVSQVVDAAHTKRQRRQINVLADVARVLTKSKSKEETLGDLATAIAGASGFDNVAISAVDKTGEKIAYRALNDFRFKDHPVSQAFRAGIFDQPMLVMSRRRRPTIFRDLASAGDDVEDDVLQLLVGRSLFSSMAFFPLRFRDELIGAMCLNSWTRHEFAEDEMTLLESLASQAVMIIKGLDMYDELRLSKEQLQEYAQRLHESMGIEYRLARTDPLTGLPNRRYLDEALASEFERDGESRGPLCLVMADVDQFKGYNDRFGHAFGDDVLKMVASVAWKTCRSGEIAGRYGGDEFLFILPGRSWESGMEFAEEFRRAVAAAHIFSPIGASLEVTVSVGVDESKVGCACEPQEVVKRADRRMYSAKWQGGNSIGEGPPLKAPGRTA